LISSEACPARAAQPQDHRGKQSDGPDARHQAAAAVKPVRVHRRHQLGLVAVQAPDAALAILAAETHVGTQHGAGQALSAGPPYREYRVVARLNARYRRAGFHDPAEHFVADNEILPALRRKRTASGGFFAVSAADADAQRLQPHLVRRGDARLGPLHQASSLSSGNNGESPHASILPRAL
jgi:hypothetical protein